VSGVIKVQPKSTMRRIIKLMYLGFISFSGSLSGQSWRSRFPALHLVLHFATMPLYTVYHPPSLMPNQRTDIAKSITTAHTACTGAPAFLVKVVFFSLDASSYYSGGHPESSLLRIVGVIRAGRSKEERQNLLQGINNGITRHGYDVEIHLEDMRAEVCHR
jgi:phenylpyruvate tautomerase PptA (4-oxalocrotonate tautomerase family)